MNIIITSAKMFSNTPILLLFQIDGKLHPGKLSPKIDLINVILNGMAGKCFRANFPDTYLTTTFTLS